ncbi:hypothetical protein VaNZ11_008127, partial [Volvox africanus]
MSSGGSDGDSVTSSSLLGKGTSAMPKLPPRPSATKERSHIAECTCGESERSADGTSNGGESVTAPVTAGAARVAATEGPAPGSSNVIISASSGPSSRPTSGPSLPPRTAVARSKTNATVTTSNSSTGTSVNFTNDSPALTAASVSVAPAASMTKSPVPWGTSGVDNGSSSGGGAGGSYTTKAESPPVTSGKMGSASPTGSGGGAAPAGLRGLRKAPMGGLPGLPPRPAPATGPVLDPDEPESLAEVRRSIHAVRVQMISAALRLGYDHGNALVKQVLYRLLLAERLKAPWNRPGRRPDPVAAAAREAARREEEALKGMEPRPSSSQGGAASTSAATSSSSSAYTGPGGGSGAPELPPLGFTVKIMLIGLQGSGKTQLAYALLGPMGRPHTAVHPFTGSTNRVTVMRGSAHGIGLEFIDTPGLSLAPGGAARNCQVLQQIRRAYQAHRPDLLVYVDRLDAPTPAAGPATGPGAASIGGAGAELAVLRNLTIALGPAMWLNTIVAFTHAGAPPPSSSRAPGTHRSGTNPAPAHTGPSFENWLEIRSHALQGVIRQASYDERLMNPVAFAESHPSCPTNTAGQPVIYNGMPWRSHLLLMLTSAKLLADTEALLQMQGGG